MISLQYEDVTVKLEHIGEGYRGDYDKTDPEDEKLLRFTVYRDEEQRESCCTLLPTTTPLAQKIRILHLILDTYLAGGDLGILSRLGPEEVE
jgi:hypothetical protein